MTANRSTVGPTVYACHTVGLMEFTFFLKKRVCVCGVMPIDGPELGVDLHRATMTYERIAFQYELTGTRKGIAPIGTLTSPCRSPGAPMTPKISNLTPIGGRAEKGGSSKHHRLSIGDVKRLYLSVLVFATWSKYLNIPLPSQKEYSVLETWAYGTRWGNGAI